MSALQGGVVPSRDDSGLRFYGLDMLRVFGFMVSVPGNPALQQALVIKIGASGGSGSRSSGFWGTGLVLFETALAQLQLSRQA